MMESTVNTGMCRCCASEGAFKDIQSTYHWMGEEEVYSDMLRECFDIILNVSEQGQDGGICEVCITQLRNAINFKKQVLHTEEQFKKHLQNKTLFRPNIVKLEMPGDEDSDDNMGSGDDGFSGAEYEVPIKTEEDDPKPKKRAAAKASATTTRASAKKAKADNGESSSKRLGGYREIKLEPEVSKTLQGLIPPRPTKSNVEKVVTTDTASKNTKVTPSKRIRNRKVVPINPDKIVLYKHYQNIRTIILHSNATPIRRHTAVGYHCCFCTQHFILPNDLKQHTLLEHDRKTKSTFMKGVPLTEYVVKLDVTGLKCENCGEDIDSLEAMMTHLQSSHKQIIHTDIKNHILPFKFEGDTLKCALCPKIYDYFKPLQGHMNVHYNNYICDICAMAYVNKNFLREHMLRHRHGEFTCEICSKVFDTEVKKLSHDRHVHLLNKSKKCPHCDQKFISYLHRNEHMVKEHGAKPPILKCKACDKTFTRKESLRNHTKRDHLLERKHECQHCEMKFFKRQELKRHMLKHTGVKQYKCEVCSKAFGRKYTLTEHMRIHADDRRFKCELCGQAFVQKCSWKSHMRSRHEEPV